ncbi:MAG: cation-efflux pump, partial [Anaerostipes hadrus]|nr:cation-efflux pump [Anaerostipes hadrus]
DIVKKYDKTLSVHDFRMVKGSTHTNVIFDLVIPYGKDYEPEKIVKDLKKKVLDEMDGKHYAVIRVDRF